MNDQVEDRIRSGLATINGNMAKQVSRGTVTERGAPGRLSRIVSAPTMDVLADCDLIIDVRRRA